MLYVLGYKGTSLVSRAIQLATWSAFSHSALCKKNGFTLEAWERGGIDLAVNPWLNHRVGTPVVVYQINAYAWELEQIWEKGIKHVGEKYDFRSILGFLPFLRRWWADSDDKWFCSHLVAHACNTPTFSLFSPQTPLYKISPGLIDYSPNLTRLGEVTDMKGFHALVNPL